MTVRTKPQACIACGHMLNAHAEVRKKGERPGEPERSPQEGDVTLCINCGCVMLFGADLTWRYPTLVEMQELQRDPAVIHVTKAIAAIPRRP